MFKIVKKILNFFISIKCNVVELSLYAVIFCNGESIKANCLTYN